eukprot:symbB.v1.2.007834.t1/scaffold463.1/size291460/15
MLSSCIHDPRSCKKLLKKNSGVPRFVPDSAVCVHLSPFEKKERCLAASLVGSRTSFDLLDCWHKRRQRFASLVWTMLGRQRFCRCCVMVAFQSMHPRSIPTTRSCRSTAFAFAPSTWVATKQPDVFGRTTCQLLMGSSS